MACIYASLSISILTCSSDRSSRDSVNDLLHYRYLFRKVGPELGRLGPGKNLAAKQWRGHDRTSMASAQDFPHYAYESKVTGPELGHYHNLSVEGSFAYVDGEIGSSDSRRSGSWRSWQPAKGVSDVDKKELDSQDPLEPWWKYPPRRLEGEKRWQYNLRKKQLGLAVRQKHFRLASYSPGLTMVPKTQQFMDDEELGDEPKGDDWRRRKVTWLCKQIPYLRLRPLGAILNDQRKWIKAEDIRHVVEYLLQKKELLRAHRVLKWEQQQPWYKFDFEIVSKVALLLGQNNKLSRSRDMYDLMIGKGMVPDLPTYDVLISGYIADGKNESLVQAWHLYNQMTQLGGHEPPPTLRYNLFHGLLQKGLTLVEQADEVFESIKMAGLVASRDMYTLLIHAHGSKGNHDRVDNLIKEMKQAGLPVGQDVFVAVLRACAKDGNVLKGEQAFVDLKKAGPTPMPESLTAVYSALIKMYTKAGWLEKAFLTFEEMKKRRMSLNLVIYESMMEVAALSGKREEAENILQDAQERGIRPLHSCYKSLLELYSGKGLLDELETAFQKIPTMRCAPNIALYNVVLEAYVTHGIVEKAEAFYEGMKGGKVRPNQRTYGLMMKLYGEAKNSAKVKEIVKEISSKKMNVPEEATKYLEAAITAKRLEAHESSQLRLSREQREMLAGVLLAGAQIKGDNRNGTYELHFALNRDSEVGSCMINHLFQQFSAWSLEAPKEQLLPDPKDPEMSKTLLAFQTVSHGSFQFFSHQYRPNHCAVIPRLVHHWLTPRALAYWYMYGGVHYDQGGGILLNVDAYSDQEIMMVVNVLKSRAIDSDKRRTKLGLVICLEGKAAVRLWRLMEPHILPELKLLLKPDSEIVPEQMSSKEEEHSMKESLVLCKHGNDGEDTETHAYE